MEKRKFNPSDWLQKPTPQKIISVEQSADSEIDNIIQQIESNQIDITAAYSNWRDIGFAFANAFGESGREYFHRISKYYNDYAANECDRQYNNCLKSRGQGITLKTFFFHAKQAGIKIQNPSSFSPKSNPDNSPLSNGEGPGVRSDSGQRPDEDKINSDAVPPSFSLGVPVPHLREGGQKPDEVNEKLPTFPDSIFPQLPDFLQKVVAVATSKEERDILMLGSIVTLSACFPKLFGIYDGKKVFPNLYLFVTAVASAGKGKLTHCKQLVKPIHKYMREQAKLLKKQYEDDLSAYNEKKGKDSGVEKPGKPPEKMLFIPANNSTTGVFQLLSDNDSRGLMFETEGDTLARAFETDYGNYSDGFRKAFHHETISYYRRTDREYVDLECPCFSCVLSGTPRQVSSLIPNAENGLLSRFIFYFMNINPEWKNVFAVTSDNGLDDYFDTLGKEFFSLYQTLVNNPEIQFCYSVEQQLRFNIFFQQIQNTYLSLQGIDYMAIIRRLGLIAFRISMILSALRITETGELSARITCDEIDFVITLEMIKILVKHASKVFSELPVEAPMQKRKNSKARFLDALPAKFSRQDYLQIALKIPLEGKTAEGYITEFCKIGLIHREKQDHYINPNANPPQS